VAKIIVEVMLKPEILDPQGQAVASALPRLGFTSLKAATSVRQGKRFEIEIQGDPTPTQLAEAEQAAQSLLSNPVIETYIVKVEK
jgi:phosphoribosylformylglycinamidine synthase subunit PurS